MSAFSIIDQMGISGTFWLSLRLRKIKFLEFFDKQIMCVKIMNQSSIMRR